MCITHSINHGFMVFFVLWAFTVAAINYTWMLLPLLHLPQELKRLGLFWTISSPHHRLQWPGPMAPTASACILRTAFAAVRTVVFSSSHVACPCRFTGAENVNRRKPPPLPAELPSGLLSWIGPVWKYPETDVINLCGLDVAVFFRLLNLGKIPRCCCCCFTLCTIMLFLDGQQLCL